MGTIPQRNQQFTKELIVLRRKKTMLNVNPTMSDHLYQFVEKPHLDYDLIKGY